MSVQDVFVSHVIASALQGGGRRGHRIDAEGAAGGQLVVARSVGTRHRNEDDLDTLVTHALTSEGADASEDGTGRGTPLVVVPVALRGREGGSSLEAGEPGDPAFALRTGGGGQSKPMVFNWRSGADVRLGVSDKPGTLHSSQAPAVGVSENQRGEVVESDVAHQLSAGGGKPGQGYPCVRVPGDESAGGAGVSMTVRRLTPLECERLMGLPPTWTKFDADGRPISDSARYRMLGNSIVLPVAQWITARIARYEAGELG
jgi:DNA (cytosine-5)-methyltransferase 1